MGRARVATKRGDRWKVSEKPKQPFDRVQFRKGLTADGREVAAQLEADGLDDWKPADILTRLVSERRIGG